MEFIVYELVQNAWDTDATEVAVTLEPVKDRPVAFLTVEDDSTKGFVDLSHAHRLFAESEKKRNPEKRGRFNLGEKLVLAAAEEATITSTTGSVLFRADGQRATSRSPRREKGTRVEARIRLTRAELTGVLDAAKLLLPPIPTTLNGEPLPSRTPFATFRATLATEIEDEEGYLRRVRRETEVRVYERRFTTSHLSHYNADARTIEGECESPSTCPRNNLPSILYEMGIPVVETDDPWDVEVMQKIPLNSDRDNVTPAYLRDLRVAVVNRLHASLPKEAASLPAVQDALADKDIEPEAVEAILSAQYGKKRAILDPSDPEANRHLIAEGYTLVPGRAHSKEAWAQIKRANALQPAGKLRPTPKFYSADGEPARYLGIKMQSIGMRRVGSFARLIGNMLLGHSVTVLFEKDRMTDSFAANYGSRTLTFNVDRLGLKWFDNDCLGPIVLPLLLHEFSHDFGGHLTEPFEDALATLGAKLARIALSGALEEIYGQANFEASLPADVLTDKLKDALCRLDPPTKNTP